jgi:uncharacterized protein
MEYIGYFAAVLIGIALGLIGSGGSILTIPVLVYLFKINPESATSYSLFIVGISSMVGAYRNYRLGTLKMKSALIFALPSLFSLIFMRKIVLPLIPETVFYTDNFTLSKDLLIMIVFASLMILASVSMINKSNNSEEKGNEVNYQKLAIIGFLVGLVTGFLGAGGGFLIIPALLIFANLPMKEAVGTSLFIIFLNATIGFSSDVLSGIELNYPLLFGISIIAITGMLIGTSLSKKIQGDKLKPAFGWFVLVMGIYIILKELFTA